MATAMDSAIAKYLTERGVTQILLTGVATSIGVEATARSSQQGLTQESLTIARLLRRQ